MKHAEEEISRGAATYLEKQVGPGGTSTKPDVGKGQGHRSGDLQRRLVLEPRALLVDASACTHRPSIMQLKVYFENILGPCWVDITTTGMPLNQSTKFLVITTSEQDRNDFLTTLRCGNNGAHDCMYFNTYTQT